MQTVPTLCNPSPRWHRRPSVSGLSVELTQWLFHSGSLTRRLRQCCANQLQVRVLGQGWGRPSRDEAQALRLRLDAWAWIREVQLLCGDQVWVFARTLVPALTLQRTGRVLTRLGNRPLGDVLFTTPGVQRSPVEIARIHSPQALYHRAVGAQHPSPALLWARRSLFYLEQQPLLVCEIFLPALPASPPLAHRMGFNYEH